MKILLGSDPELFVFKDGEPISAHGMVDGTKEHPLVVKGGAVQVDGMALEYNTDPVSCYVDWEINHLRVQEQLKDMIEDGLELKPVPTAFFSEEVFNTTPKEALILGCEPDMNAYTQRNNPVPNAKVKFRTGAGHIHIGWGEGFDVKDPFHIEECCALTQTLDTYLGVPSIVMDEDVDRRMLYGKAGAFRPKPYGLEYRTLSNFWTKTEGLRRWAYDNTIIAIDMALNGGGANDWARRVINNNSFDDAKYYCKIYDIPVFEGEG